ncbi:undecaprenyldiphospho-muramoylpentapeptide beta-N-acetylglucosaminyltransferase [Aestuariivirga litoralis]|uniref:UDP-N-acetylglucosamine--N-acetylmuramyl-(pentapeptide) pyrophosphoryl-undecaprenol N-acetylglucosamine transferase n=1 Tax=Aestuariivirga litoralis TaxID=2650924 RepID=A0A2W2BJD1_9HYPH|nr:undecaprenyldiphospho-muramoylpentapeptide beta-N-acetylglucosaminyltransferase [Aestuariivirga litoralis]PZF75997.1 undecaprenyldiphospho-muramoylpentapeptide beta-N-acetylglucosaminyltransferase [Aestuariivirga litoralis]
MSKGTFVLAAGGTGGHLFPAQALAEELIRRGYTIHLMTDERVRDYGKSFPGTETHIVPSATLSLSKPWLVPSRVLRLYSGYRAARSVLTRVKPLAVIGFGGYPSFPPIMAAARLRIPSCVHDQNAVMGRANRVLAKWADAVASSFPTLMGLPPEAKSKLTFTGNPVRDIALKEMGAPYPGFDTFNLLVFGGSQGAQFFGEFMPKVFNAMTPDQRKGIRLTQQVRAENMAAVSAAYEALGLDCELNPFFMDMPRRIADAHLVVCRSGASTIAELGVIGRPAVMVPLPHALDNDQLRNAESFAQAGAGWVHPQATLEPTGFAQFLTSLRSQQGQLQQAAAAALKHGKPDAAQRLADLAEKLGKGHYP